MQVEDLKRVAILDSIFRPKEGKTRGSGLTSGRVEMERTDPRLIAKDRSFVEQEKERIDGFLQPMEIYDCRGKILKLGLGRLSSLNMVL